MGIMIGIVIFSTWNKMYCNEITKLRGVRGAVRFSQNHNCTTPHFCGHMCGAMRCIV